MSHRVPPIPRQPPGGAVLSASIVRRMTFAALSLSTAAATCSLLASPASANPAGTALVINEAYVNGARPVRVSSTSSSSSTTRRRAPSPSSATPSSTGADEHRRAERRPGVHADRTVAAHGHFLIMLPGNGATTNPGAPLPTPDLFTGGSVNPGAGGGTPVHRGQRVGCPPDRRQRDRQRSAGAPATRRDQRADRQLDHAELPASRGRHRHRQQRGRLRGRRADPAERRVRRGRRPQSGHRDEPGNQTATQGVVTAAYPTGGFQRLLPGGPVRRPVRRPPRDPGASDAVFVFGRSGRAGHGRESVQSDRTVSSSRRRRDRVSDVEMASPAGSPVDRSTCRARLPPRRSGSAGDRRTRGGGLVSGVRHGDRTGPPPPSDAAFCGSARRPRSRPRCCRVGAVRGSLVSSA